MWFVVVPATGFPDVNVWQNIFLALKHEIICHVLALDPNIQDAFPNILNTWISVSECWTSQSMSFLKKYLIRSGKQGVTATL